ncbi:hypothetical protein VNO80_22717 [Phaseolus coccineus]|uniref:Uncharacterized protein n=1 Tax=Phaseolus coccineus TaxID=3886 RepID=A0AAN9QUB0_PHACN
MTTVVSFLSPHTPCIVELYHTDAPSGTTTATQRRPRSTRPLCSTAPPPHASCNPPLPPLPDAPPTTQNKPLRHPSLFFFFIIL